MKTSWLNTPQLGLVVLVLSACSPAAMRLWSRLPYRRPRPRHHLQLALRQGCAGVLGQIDQVDDAGYLARIWYPIQAAP